MPEMEGQVEFTVPGTVPDLDKLLLMREDAAPQADALPQPPWVSDAFAAPLCEHSLWLCWVFVLVQVHPVVEHALRKMARASILQDQRAKAAIVPLGEHAHVTAVVQPLADVTLVALGRQGGCVLAQIRVVP
eukprot:CAMPEP_0179108680 /NCGR_PEP_ID=MMETSP0796-20121207/50635_1 /TAXON_ID=73915 /ORGANISM="Pyrodinium bahamense, Strain pbaha01" /LENGTH=131 /DNA_ID=CAMNT_0020806759 /DNA_START=256 /DNA_END=651 /DNA_ORIENTATION=+